MPRSRGSLARWRGSLISSTVAAHAVLPGLRRWAAMVFAPPVALPMSIYENAVYGLRLAVVRDRRRLDAADERSLSAATLWSEVKDRLDVPGLNLSCGQQQRLSIVRALRWNRNCRYLMRQPPRSIRSPWARSKIC